MEVITIFAFTVGKLLIEGTGKTGSAINRDIYSGIVVVVDCGWRKNSSPTRWLIN